MFSHVIPAEFSLAGSTSSKTLSEKIQNSAPIASLIKNPLPIKPFFEEIAQTVTDKYSIASNPNIRCDQSQYECRTVAMFSQYAEGAEWWGTPSLSLENAFDSVKSFFDVPTIMDAAPKNEAIAFINNYFSKETLEGKKKRFPALFSIYFSGLDHYAHGMGMGGYSNFFQQTTDPQIGDFVKALKDQGEFDNKIFVIVSDHGMTAMPTGLTYRDKNWLGIEGDKLVEMSCTLNLDLFDPESPDNITSAQKAELAKNNLHI